MKQIVAGLAALATAIALPGLASAQAPQSQPSGAEPEHIQVQHILIGFTGSVGGKQITRTQEEARKLAYEILDRARKGEDFDGMVKKYTDDSHPGIYGMANKGVPPTVPGESARDRMVAAFGDVGFKLKVGEVGIADLDPKKSPYGWHIIKRIK